VAAPGQICHGHESRLHPGVVCRRAAAMTITHTFGTALPETLSDPQAIDMSPAWPASVAMGPLADERLYVSGRQAGAQPDTSNERSAIGCESMWRHVVSVLSYNIH
jgi:hypothetical protein